MLSVALYFSFHVLYFSAPESILFYFMTSTSVLHFSFFVYSFLIPFNCLSVFTYSLLNFLKTAILCFLLGKSQISICLGLATERVLLSFDGVMSLDIACTLKPYIAVFAFEVAFPLLVFTDWLWEKTPFSVSPAMNAEVISNLLWICLLHTSCSLLWQKS